MGICVILWFLPQAIEQVPVFELMKEVSRFEGGFKEFKRGAKVLDSVYIPTRYPNGIAGDLVPYEHYEIRSCPKFHDPPLNIKKSPPRPEMIGDPFSHNGVLSMFLTPFRSFNRKCRMGSSQAAWKTVIMAQERRASIRPADP